MNEGGKQGFDLGQTDHCLTVMRTFSGYYCLHGNDVHSIIVILQGGRTDVIGTGTGRISGRRCCCA